MQGYSVAEVARRSTRCSVYPALTNGNHILMLASDKTPSTHLTAVSEEMHRNMRRNQKSRIRTTERFTRRRPKSNRGEISEDLVQISKIHD